MSALVVVRFSIAQARAAKEALDKLTIEADLDHTTDAAPEVIDRAGEKLRDAMRSAGVEL